MNYPFIQYIIAGGRGTEGLVDILIIVFFVVIWVIRTLFMTQKEQSQKQKKPLSRKPSTKPSLSKDRVEKFLENILQPKSSSQTQKNRHVLQKPQSASYPAAIKKSFDNRQQKRPLQYKPKKPSFVKSQRPESPQIHDLPAIDPKLEQLPEFTDKTINKLEQIHLIKQKDVISSNYLSEKLFNKADPDELKKAILYSEILGKPLSIRELSD